jgi:hypothetical protein
MGDIKERGMHPTDKAARVAGALYLLMVLVGPFALIYVPGRLIVRGNATATATNVLAHETMFRLGIVADLIGTVIFILAVLALYRLLGAVNTMLASHMVALALVSAAVGFLNVLNHIAALILFRGGEFLAVFDRPQREALGMLFLRLYGQGIAINEIFWGLWLLPFGLLVMRSGFLPRILGVLLIINCFAWVAEGLTSLLLPDYASVVHRYATIPEFGEILIMLWLLIKGAGVRPLAAAAAS